MNKRKQQNMYQYTKNLNKNTKKTRIQVLENQYTRFTDPQQNKQTNLQHGNQMPCKINHNLLII